MTATQPVVVQVLPPPKIDWWEGPGFFPAIAALLAVAISYFGLQSSTKKQIEAAAAREREQLLHSTKEGQLEREQSAKRATADRLDEARQQLYSGFVDEYMSVLRMFSQLPFARLENLSELTLPLQALGASVNKSWLLSNVKTVTIVREFFSDLNVMYFSLLREAQPLRELNEKIQLTVADLKNVRQEKLLADQAFQKMRENHEPVYSQEFQDVAVVASNMHDRQEKLSDDLLSAQERHRALLINYTHNTVERQTAMMDRLNQVMAAARRELGHVEDTTLLELQSIEMAERAKAELSKFIHPDSSSVVE